MDQENKQSNVTALVVLVLILLAGLGAFYYFNSQNTDDKSMDLKVDPNVMEDAKGDSMTPGGAAGTMPEGTPGDVMDTDMSPGVEGEKSFTVIGTNFAFDIKEMKVKKGDKVTITFRNNEGFHDWVLDEFDAKTKQLSAGGEETIEFLADKVGTFEYYCSVGKHRENGMVGKFIVE